MFQLLNPQAKHYLLIIAAMCTSLTMLKGQLYHSDLDRTFQLDVQVSFQYILHLPENLELTAEGKFPLILYLHGNLDSGSNMEALKSSGPPRIVNGQPKFPFAVLAPLCPDGEVWNIQHLDLLLDYMIDKYPIDPSRIYLTGVDMGAWATWEWSWNRPRKFAAIAPISGWGELLWLSRLKELPVWVFHGALDKEVPVSRSTELYAGLKDLKNVNAKLTVFSTATHNCSERVYNDEALYEWFLSHAATLETE